MPPKTSKNKPVAYTDGYEYRFDKLSADGSTAFWRCSKFSCRARAFGPAGSVNITQKTDGHSHCHEPEPALEQVRTRVTAAKDEAVQNRHKSTRELVQECNARLTQEELNLMPERSAQMKTVVRQRYEKGNTGVNADDARNIVFYDGVLDLDGVSLLLHDSRTVDPNEDVFLIFGTREALARMRQYRHWSADGTFKVCPPSFKQLYTFNVLIGHSSLPCIYVLMQRRLEQSYEQVFGVIRTLVGAGLDPESLMTDFEIGAQMAAQATWPNVTLRSCLFHLGQSVWRKTQALKLDTLFRQEPQVRKAIRCLSALAFLRPEEVPDAYDLLQASVWNAFPAVRPLFNYFGSNYVNAAMFPIESWNVHDTVESHLGRTNNAIEGWHNAFSKKFRSPHPTLSVLIAGLKTEELDAQAKMLRFTANPAGGIGAKPRLAKYKIVDAAITEYVRQYDDDDPATRSVLQHLGVLQYQLAKSK